MSDERIYRRCNVLWRRTHDSVLLLVPACGEFITLQASGCDLWAVLEVPGTLSALAERLAHAYDTPVERIAADITPILEELDRRGAIGVLAHSGDDGRQADRELDLG